MFARRHLLAALFAAAAVSACAEAPTLSPAPVARGGDAPGSDLARRAGLSGEIGFVVADVRTGETLDALNAETPFAPASVAKAPTALYALAALGPEHRFETRLEAVGPIEGRRLSGRLALIGGGDPELDSAGLAAIAREAAVRLSAVEGELVVVAGPVTPLIDPDQPERAAYNPSVAALNLNYNRVRLSWENGVGAALHAHAVGYSPAVTAVRLETAPRDCGCPAIAYASGAGFEGWRVRDGALRGDGSVWLPVRDPGLYAAEVFRLAAAEAGLSTPQAALAYAGPVSGLVIARRQSRPLAEIVADMLRWSTNLTAETLGHAAAAAQRRGGGGLDASAAAMGDWAASYAGFEPGPEFAMVNHSGLSAESRVSPRRMAALLGAAWREGEARGPALIDLLPERGSGSTDEGPWIVRAKTGTMDFVRGLAGYVVTPSGRILGFAIFANDLARRDASPETGETRPGARSWRNRAVTLEKELIESWVERFG